MKNRESEQKAHNLNKKDLIKASDALDYSIHF